MSSRLDELRDLARHERDVLRHYRDMEGSEDEVPVQPGAGGTQAGQIRLVRLYGFHYLDIGGGFLVADYFLGTFIHARGQPNPDPMPDPTAIYGRRFPLITLNHDLAKVVPAYPFFGTTAPGAPDFNAAQSDVLAIWLNHHNVPIEEGGGRWELVNDLIGVCT